VVNQTWETVTIAEDARGKHRPETIYAWNLKEFDTTTLTSDVNIIGAQICAWESGGEIQVPSLRSRVPAMSERIWNMDAGKSFDDFTKRYAAIDPMLDTLIRPYITEENRIKSADVRNAANTKQAEAAAKKKPEGNPDHFADPYNPPFDISEDAKDARKKIYEVNGLKKLSGGNSPLKEGMRISFFGDSITWQKIYVNEIKSALSKGTTTGITVFNRGVNGAGIKHLHDGVSNFYQCAQSSFKEVLAEDKPDIAVLFIGINDILFLNTKPEEYEKTLNELMQTAQASGVRYCVIASPWLRQELPNGKNPHDAAIRAYAAICKKTAENDRAPMKTGFVDLHKRAMAYLQNNNVELLDTGFLKFKPHGVLTYDGLHPNATGNRFLAEQIADAICNTCK
jgi:lysophospholipase L1-like esterase